MSDLVKDARLAAECLNDVGSFETGQSILTECADRIEQLTATIKALEAEVSDLRGKLAEYQDDYGDMPNPAYLRGYNDGSNSNAPSGVKLSAVDTLEIVDCWVAGNMCCNTARTTLAKLKGETE